MGILYLFAGSFREIRFHKTKVMFLYWKSYSLSRKKLILQLFKIIQKESFKMFEYINITGTKISDILN